MRIISFDIGVHNFAYSIIDFNQNNNNWEIKHLHCHDFNKDKKIKDIIVKEQVFGDNFRILILNNKIIGIIKRSEPYFIGNGKLRLYDLIKNYNNKQIKNKMTMFTYIQVRKINFTYLLTFKLLCLSCFYCLSIFII